MYGASIAIWALTNCSLVERKPHETRVKVVVCTCMHLFHLSSARSSITWSEEDGYFSLKKPVPTAYGSEARVSAVMATPVDFTQMVIHRKPITEQRPVIMNPWPFIDTLTLVNITWRGKIYWGGIKRDMFESKVSLPDSNELYIDLGCRRNIAAVFDTGAEILVVDPGCLTPQFLK